jgi:hypothetical protein
MSFQRVRRREFIAGLCGTVAWPLVPRAQQPERIRHIGVLFLGTLQPVCDVALGSRASPSATIDGCQSTSAALPGFNPGYDCPAWWGRAARVSDGRLHATLHATLHVTPHATLHVTPHVTPHGTHLHETRRG